jgi:hypothetical protein
MSKSPDKCKHRVANTCRQEYECYADCPDLEEGEDRAECGCLKEDVSSSWCECCQVTTTYCHHNTYGTCMCS